MDTQTVNKRLISGFFSLTFRRVGIYALTFLTINIILAPILPVEVIGTFNIANTILSLFAYFSDIGLAAAVIQKREINEEDLKTTFTIQEVLVLFLAILIWFSAPLLADYAKISGDGMWLVRALAISFFLTSFKVLPSVLLERDLKFGPLVWVELLEVLIFNILLIYLSFANFGITGFSIAAITRAIVGVVSIYLVAPWKIKFGLSKSAAKELLSFGVPFQLNSILAMVKDRLVYFVVSGIIGPLGWGYISWAQSLAFLPLEVMNIIIRLTFPAYARLQQDYLELKRAVEKSLFVTSLLLFPLLFGLLATAPALISYVVTDKWQPALPLIYLFSINTFWATISTTFTNLLNAIGKIRTTLNLMIMWTILTWVLSPFLAIKYGYIGVALASALISVTSLVPIIIVKRLVDVEILKNIFQPLIASLVMGVLVYFVSSSFVRDKLTFFIVVGLGGLIYVGVMLLISKKKILYYFRSLKNGTS